MKTPPVVRCGIVSVTLLAMIQMANAQNNPNPSNAKTAADLPPPGATLSPSGEVLPAPPAPLPQPSRTLAPAPPPAPTGTRGTTTGRGPAASLTRTAVGLAPLRADSVWTAEQTMNDDFVTQFNNTGNFGGGRMPMPTMRVSPQMRLNLTDEVKGDGPAKKVTASYRIYSLELLGIAMHKTPVAYVVVRHKDNTASLNNRALTDFEVDAVKQLQDGKQVVDKMVNTERLMVGAVRAQQSCIDCHTGSKIGDVLGAFSYHLVPATGF